MTSASFAVVVPFFNEEENVDAACLELKEVLCAQLPGGEVVLVDDGSSDGTGERLDELALVWPECRVYHLEENQGQSAALLFGISKTTAPVIVTMDGDCQNDPRDIPRLLARLKEADMVVGVRVARKDSWARRRVSRIANRLRAQWLGDGVSDAGCALKAFRREVARAFLPIRTLYSFMPALAVIAGYRVVEEPVNHRPRAHGDSRYSLWNFLFLPIVDFVGLSWFRSRRCSAGGKRPLDTGAFTRRLPRPSFQRWALAVTMAASGVVVATLVFNNLRNHSSGLDARRIELAQAERIAVHRAHGSRATAEELRESGGHLIWEVDVQIPTSRDITEVDIDAINGHVLGIRTESPEEEALEVAVEDHLVKSPTQTP